MEIEAYLKTAASKCTEYNVYWYACSRCDVSAKDDAAVTEKGSKHEECKVCHDKKAAVEIPATPHGGIFAIWSAGADLTARRS